MRPPPDRVGQLHLLLLRSSHPPSGAIVLILSLRLLQTPQEMIDLMVGVVLLTIVGWAVNRAGRGSGAGVDSQRMRPPRGSPPRPVLC
jgi:hypothetical protein